MDFEVKFDQARMSSSTEWNKLLTELGFDDRMWPLVKTIKLTVSQIQLEPS